MVLLILEILLGLGFGYILIRIVSLLFKQTNIYIKAVCFFIGMISSYFLFTNILLYLYTGF